MFYWYVDIDCLVVKTRLCVFSLEVQIGSTKIAKNAITCKHQKNYIDGIEKYFSMLTMKNYLSIRPNFHSTLHVIYNFNMFTRAFNYNSDRNFNS